MFNAIHHVNLVIPKGEEPRARAFYEGVLGLPEVEQPDEQKVSGGCWFELGTVRIHISIDPDFKPSTKAHTAFQIDALQPLRERIEAAQLPVKEGSDVGGLERFFAFDPFGNRLEFMAPIRQ
ncbi:VOC family protein [Parasphingorhabdus sp. DH2-15]|uniref:VOC family protein n=1 Tax=Parasphingorhabdus sp. DH2-15 TaxID=3444112 RepID=UPI003F688E6A